MEDVSLTLIIIGKNTYSSACLKHVGLTLPLLRTLLDLMFCTIALALSRGLDALEAVEIIL